MPKVSIIIPVYNVEPAYIQEAVNSALNQTLSNIEIIIVNDGSTNLETLEYLKTIDNPIIKIVNQENKGPGGARNTGIENSTGEYIGFLDADDWLDDNFYEILYNLCETNNANIACGTLVKAREDKQINIDKFDNVIIDNFIDKMKLVHNGSICSKLFKRDFIQNIHFIEHKYWEDNLFLVETFLKSRNVAFTNTVRYYYRENQTSICLNSEKLQKRQIDGFYILNKIYDVVKNEKIAYQNIAINTFSFLAQKNTYNNHREYLKNANKFLNKNLIKFVAITSNPNSFLQNIFSIKNNSTKTHKIITILWIKFKIKLNKYKKFYYWSETDNAGDIFNLDLINYFNIPYKLITKPNKANFIAVGSILDFFIKNEIKKQQNNLIVLGSGFIKKYDKKKYFTKNLNIIALRGQYTKPQEQYFLNKNLGDIPLGDYGLLISKMYPNTNNSKLYDVGIIPHYIDKDNSLLNKINLENKKIIFIDIQNKPQLVAKQICSCKIILSSSLHGLIFADSYLIPNRQIILSDKITGNNFKFKDYYSAFNIEPLKAIDLRTEEISNKTIDTIAKTYPITSKIIINKQNELIKAILKSKIKQPN